MFKAVLNILSLKFEIWNISFMFSFKLNLLYLRNYCICSMVIRKTSRTRLTKYL